MAADYGIPENPALTTNSWFRAWWLHSVWGYQVVDVRQSPRANCWGNLAYDATYRLIPREVAERPNRPDVSA